MDIQKLNKIVFLDSYPLLFQFEIIANVQICTNFIILDGASFFYQWLFYPDYHFMFTIITYCSQETFQILIMGYINLMAYVQYKIDNILQNMLT